MFRRASILAPLVVAFAVLAVACGEDGESVQSGTAGKSNGRDEATGSASDLVPNMTSTVAEILDEVSVFDELGNVRFETLLLAGGRFEAMPDLRAAVTPAGLEELQRSLPLGEALPEVDLDTSIVIAFSFIDDACPPTLIRLDEGPAGVITPVLEEPPGGCNVPAIARTLIVALNRDDVSPGFVLRVTQRRQGEVQEHVLPIDVPPELRDDGHERDTGTLPPGPKPAPVEELDVYDAGGVLRCYSESVESVMYNGPSDVLGFATIEAAVTHFWTKEYGGGAAGYPYAI